jgi:hypothetical protein
LVERADATTSSLPRRVRTKSEACEYAPLWSRKLEWLPWTSNGLERGIKAHKATSGGYVEEAGDRAPNRKKIKGISSRQWERRF